MFVTACGASCDLLLNSLSNSDTLRKDVWSKEPVPANEIVAGKNLKTIG